MKAIKVVTILGTRPEAIKMAPVIQECRRHPERVQVHVCVTGQHRQMLDQVLELFRITSDSDLDLMQKNQTPTQVAARVLLELDRLLTELRPDWVLVQGDTTSVMAAAIAAHHLRIRVGHVEAGLRTGDRFNPFPEEMNRIIADHLSNLHFAPTQRACENLRREGISDSRIRLTGNTVVDALNWVVQKSLVEEQARIYPLEDHSDRTPPGTHLLNSIHPQNSKARIILVTAHRRESFGPPLQQICMALRELVRQRDDIEVVYPVHLNPNVHGPVYDMLGAVPRIKLLPPLDYLTLIHLMKQSYLILTDSGGIQEEAPTLGIPVLVLREVTERPEAVEAGAAKVVGTSADRIVKETTTLLDDSVAYAAMARAINPYGDGRAAERIVSALMEETQP